jgi:hypothetical protein
MERRCFRYLLMMLNREGARAQGREATLIFMICYAKTDHNNHNHLLNLCSSLAPLRLGG